MNKFNIEQYGYNKAEVNKFIDENFYNKKFGLPQTDSQSMGAIVIF